MTIVAALKSAIGLISGAPGLDIGASAGTGGAGAGAGRGGLGMGLGAEARVTSRLAKKLASSRGNGGNGAFGCGLGGDNGG